MSAAQAVARGADRSVATPAPVRAARWAPWLVAALLGLLALPPRIADVDRFLTTDEIFWMGRTGNFARALAVGQLGQTFQSGHPGVTTMWTALLGVGPVQAEQLAGARRIVSRREVSQKPAFMDGLPQARRAFGIVTAVGVGLAVLLAWRLFGPGPAVLGGSLLALDPFFIAHARLVHIDASLAVWMSLALLAAVAHWSGSGGKGTFALAGVATGLALLSKSPALLLLAFVPLSAVLLRGAGAVRDRRVWRDLALWVGLTGLTYAALWPAMWVAPLETLGGVLEFVRDNANPSQAAAADEEGTGALFYGWVFLLRSTPLTLLGLLLLPLVRPAARTARIALVLALFAVGFGLAMTVTAKNFDRYLLPAFPTLDLLAGLGLWQALARLTPAPRRMAITAAVAAGVIGLSGWWVAGAWPHVLTYANPLLGGPAFASARIASGWGEGLEQVAAYLNRRPDAERLRVAMPGEIYKTVLDAQFVGQVAPAEGADAAAYDYFVVYLRNLQRGERPEFFDDRYLVWAPELAVSLSGVDYAWVYNTATGAPVGATFGEVVDLEGYGIEAAGVRPGRRAQARLHWRARDALPPDLRLALELRSVDADGVTLGEVLPLQREAVSWTPGALVEATYSVSIPSDARRGAYVLAIRVLDAGGRPLPLTRRPALGPDAVPEPDAVALRSVQIR